MIEKNKRNLKREKAKNRAKNAQNSKDNLLLNID
jgi:hypothetical protein